MELLQLRYFRSAAECENFSLAAEKHRIPQSAISKTIRKLENELECELFSRKGKKVYLNENGKLFLIQVDSALLSIDTAVKELKKKKIKQITLYIQAGVKYVTDLIHAFHSEYSDMRVIFFQGESNLILNEEPDFTIMQLPLYTDEFEYKTLMNDEIQLAVSTEHRLARKKTISIKQLKQEKFIGFCKNNQLRELTDQYCSSHGFLPNVIYEANEAALFRSMIEANSGISLVPSHSFIRYKSDNIILIPLEESLHRELVLAWKKHSVMREESEYFLQFACEWFHRIMRA